jgi:hypothetical protein
MLLGALMVVQLAVFYFGWGLGIYAAVLSALAFITITLVLPPRRRARCPRARRRVHGGAVPRS